MTPRERIEWEIDGARRMLDRARQALQARRPAPYLDIQATGTAWQHALFAWCRTHSDVRVANTDDCQTVFFDTAPESLKKSYFAAHAAMQSAMNGWGRFTDVEALDRVAAAVEALLAAAGEKLADQA